jgi:epsin
MVVRNRAKELAELLGDSEKIRAERKKAKQTKTKYVGVGSEEAGFGGTGKKYGGFGSDDLSYGSYSGQVYGTFSYPF